MLTLAVSEFLRPISSATLSQSYSGRVRWLRSSDQRKRDSWVVGSAFSGAGPPGLSESLGMAEDGSLVRPLDILTMIVTDQFLVLEWIDEATVLGVGC